MTDPFNSAGTVAYYAGARMPDIVAALGVQQSWGSAQASAVIHQIPVVGVNGANVESEYGYAVMAGFTINLPAISPGDYFWATAAFAEGATSYVHSDWMPLATNSASFGNSRSYYQADAYIDTVTNAVAKSNVWGVAGQFQHYWAPTLRSGFFGSYAQFDNPAIAGVQVAGWDYWAAGANIIWSPVVALDIGIEAAYQHISGRNVQKTAAGVPVDGSVAAVGQKDNDGALSVRFRIQRSF